MQFEDICKENYPKIYNYILARTRSKETAEDITQEVFLIACQKGEAFLSHKNPAAFLYVSAKNLLFEYFRESARHLPLEEREMEDTKGDIFEQICEEHIRSLNEDAYLVRILDGLNEKERRLYKLHYTDKKTMKDIAGELHINETALRMKYVRLRKKVKRIVKALEPDAF